jgi:hypothetical protein
MDDRGSIFGGDRDLFFSPPHADRFWPHIKPPIQWVPGLKRPGPEDDRSPSSFAEDKNAWNYTCTFPYVFMTWYLVQHRDKLTFRFYFGIRPEMWKIFAAGIAGHRAEIRTDYL